MIASIVIILLVVILIADLHPGALRDLGGAILRLFLYVILPFAVMIFFGIHGPLVWR